MVLSSAFGPVDVNPLKDAKLNSLKCGMESSVAMIVVQNTAAYYTIPFYTIEHHFSLPNDYPPLLYLLRYSVAL
jgi:hypothetical protein